MANYAKIAAGVAIVAAVGVGSAAHAVTYGVVPGSGYSSSASGKSGVGNSGSDAFGNPWLWNKTAGPKGPDSPGTGFSAWGTPGLSKGGATYEGSQPASLFAVSFDVDGTGATFNQTPSPSAGGSNEFTRFDVCTTSCVEWTPVFLDSQNEVDFYAPAGDDLTDGEHYFVNVIFNQKTLSGENLGFAAAFLSVVPEASTWSMMIVGIAGIGGAMRNSRRKHLTSFIG